MMEKRTKKIDTTQLEHLNFSAPSESFLLTTLPGHYLARFHDLDNCCEQTFFEIIMALPSVSKTQELMSFFEFIGADLVTWEQKPTPQEKAEYIFEMLEKSTQDGLKRLNNQQSNYLNIVKFNRKGQRIQKQAKQRQKQDEFDWLFLNTKNEMLKSKLKTKLVQAINQYKNEKKLREVMDKQLDEQDKIHLEDDQSIDLYQDDKSKVEYHWTKDDQEMFLRNIRKLKDKFMQTQFLKNCHRYKVITESELKTLAAQQISRKLDKNNKAFLSREFLLDKYFSANEYLTQKQMKFILKTSPLLSKCVDKAFVRSAIKNIKYDDIDKMELQIAEQIIQKFEVIRNIVNNSRKAYKQKQNSKVKKRIEIFEKQKEADKIRQDMTEKLGMHKTKMLRNMNYKYKSSFAMSKNKTQTNFHEEQSFPYSSMKKVWPIPFNNKHPSTGLFIRDCSEQLNDDFNEYEKQYMRKMSHSEANPIKKSSQAQATMINFYTGGPLMSPISNKIDSNSSMLKCSSVTKPERMGKDVLKIVCETFKLNDYLKKLQEKLNIIQIQPEQDQSDPVIGFQRGQAESLCADPKTKKITQEEDSSSNSPIKILGPTEKNITAKLLEMKIDSRMNFYVKKLHALAAENSLLSLKALNMKFTPSQVNSFDSKGNTALFYATKHQNADFIDYLLGMKADVNSKCQKGTTPLHNAFKSGNYSIICKCLTGPNPNLNALDEEGKTPLAYCCRKILEMLNLQEGVVSVAKGEKMKFNNNSLMTTKFDKKTDDELQLRLGLQKCSTKKLR